MYNWKMTALQEEFCVRFLECLLLTLHFWNSANSQFPFENFVMVQSRDLQINVFYERVIFKGACLNMR